MNSTTPLFTLVIAYLFLARNKAGDRISVAGVTGLLVGLAGVVVLVSRPSGSAIHVVAETSQAWPRVAGHLAILGASVCYGAGAVFARRKLAGVPRVVQAFLPLGFAVPQSFIPQTTIAWLALVWLGLLGSCVVYLLHAVGPTRTILVTYPIAVVGVLLGVIVFGEKLDWRLAIGTGAVAAGVWVVNK